MSIGRGGNPGDGIWLSGFVANRELPCPLRRRASFGYDGAVFRGRVGTPR